MSSYTRASMSQRWTAPRQCKMRITFAVNWQRKNEPYDAKGRRPVANQEVNQRAAAVPLGHSTDSASYSLCGHRTCVSGLIVTVVVSMSMIPIGWTSVAPDQSYSTFTHIPAT